MKTYNTVEDYLEVLAGLTDVSTGNRTSTWFFGFSPIISLARYDVSVLTSMSEATIANKPLTEKQGKLLCSILLKYERQLANKGIDVSPINNPQWRMTLRKMDYTKSLALMGDKIALKFPFDTKLIDEIRAFKSQSQGACVFEREETKKYWSIALTEFNLNWLHAWASINEFEIDPELIELNDLITKCEAVPHKMELVFGKTEMEITNCTDSLKDYIITHLGGFSHDNMLRLIDNSSVLGYTYEPSLINVVSDMWGSQVAQLSDLREVRIDPSSVRLHDEFASILGYATKVNRLPVVIYEPDMRDRFLKTLIALYPEDQIHISGNNKRIPELPSTVRFIHTNKPIRNMNKVPLLVTSIGMIFGGDKQIMTQKTEKFVYITDEVYNATGGASNRSKKVPKLAG